MARKRDSGRHNRIVYYAVAILALTFVVGSITFFLSTGTNNSKSVILFVNQGNGVVNEADFGSLLGFAQSRGFNTIFFQVYRSGTLLFNGSELHYFVGNAHSVGLKIFFDLYFTNSSQLIPVSAYGLGEDGINLDMSALPLPAEQELFTILQTNYKNGMTAITTTDVNLPLRPSLLILETYGVQNQQFIRHGIIGGVGVFATSSMQDYKQEFEYALNNSDDVMVFDYAGLLKRGY